MTKQAYLGFITYRTGFSEKHDMFYTIYGSFESCQKAMEAYLPAGLILSWEEKKADQLWYAVINFKQMKAEYEELAAALADERFHGMYIVNHEVKE